MGTAQGGRSHKKNIDPRHRLSKGKGGVVGFVGGLSWWGEKKINMGHGPTPPNRINFGRNSETHEDQDPQCAQAVDGGKDYTAKWEARKEGPGVWASTLHKTTAERNIFQKQAISWGPERVLSLGEREHLGGGGGGGEGGGGGGGGVGGGKNEVEQSPKKRQDLGCRVDGTHSKF